MKRTQHIACFCLRRHDFRPRPAISFDGNQGLQCPLHVSGLGLCDAQLDKEKEALDAFEKALAINPNMPGIRQNADALKKSLAAKSI